MELTTDNFTDKQAPNHGVILCYPWAFGYFIPHRETLPANTYTHKDRPKADLFGFENLQITHNEDNTVSFVVDGIPYTIEGRVDDEDKVLKILLSKSRPGKFMLILTPITFALDIVISPIQGLMLLSDAGHMTMH